MKKQLIAIGVASVIVGTLYTVQMAKAKRDKPQTVNPVTP
jgi:general stress protein CsbA